MRVKKLTLKKSQVGLVIISILIFAFIARFSIVSVNKLSGVSSAIHYTGFVGGATQMLVKEEVNGTQNDALLQLLDEMIPMLVAGEGEYKVPVTDPLYQGHLTSVEKEWQSIKEEIYKVRQGGESDKLFRYSENTYNDITLAAYAAQGYMESSVKSIKNTMFVVYAIFFGFMGLLLVTLFNNRILVSKAETLNQIAYYDPFTGISNRLYCDKLIEEYEKNSYQGNLTVFAFDLNNLKLVNDKHGHAAGDIMIRSFSLALEEVGHRYGFVGRIGGDEFIGIFEQCDQEKARKFLKELVTNLQRQNSTAKKPWERVSFAAGFATGQGGDKNIRELLQGADDHMYRVKRKMKEKIKG